MESLTSSLQSSVRTNEEIVEELKEQLKTRETQLVEVATREETISKDLSGACLAVSVSPFGVDHTLASLLPHTLHVHTHALAVYEQKLSAVRDELTQTKQALTTAEQVCMLVLRLSVRARFGLRKHCWLLVSSRVSE